MKMARGVGTEVRVRNVGQLLDALADKPRDMKVVVSHDPAVIFVWQPFTEGPDGKKKDIGKPYLSIESL
jgi:hypothetical protein